MKVAIQLLPHALCFQCVCIWYHFTYYANWNWRVHLCGQCMDALYLLVYSYELKCVKCVYYTDLYMQVQGVEQVMIRLYGQDFKPLVCGLTLKPLRRHWNVTTLLYGASFIFLSSTCLLAQSPYIYVLVPTPVYTYTFTVHHETLSFKCRGIVWQETLPFSPLHHIVLFAMPMVLLFVYPFYPQQDRLILCILIKMFRPLQHYLLYQWYCC